MQKNIVWKGLEYNSLENCIVTMQQAEIEVQSVIVGCYHQVPYRVAYHLKTNAVGNTIFLNLETQLHNTIQTLELHSDGDGNWFSEGRPQMELNGCIDVDIAVTPFTNTLPIRRLSFVPDTPQQIRVVYFDIFAQQMNALTQQYTQLSATHYTYQNVPNDFEATITVNEWGLVEDYPQLFTQTLLVESCY